MDLSQEPKLPTPFPVVRPLWTDTETGLKVPKRPGENLRWRVKLLTMAEKDACLRDDLYAACSQSILFWINFVAFTYRKFRVLPDGRLHQCTASESHVPYVTWDIQDEHILEIKNAIDTGHDLLTDKSRDMGATWDHVAVIHWFWLFFADRSFLELSRKEDCVDTYGRAGETGSDPGTLLGKHDYLNRWLPDWMKPGTDRRRMHLLNLVNQSRIDGESANATAGSSDRRTAILLDEMAKMVEGEAIKRSTRDVTACRLANSTPHGPGTAFSKWRQSGTVEVFPMMYWDHPEKGLGRYVKQDEYSGKWEIRSPWFNREEKIRTPKEMATEVLADHISSGETFFEGRFLAAHKRMFGRQPRFRMNVDFRRGVAESLIPTIIGRVQLDFVAAKRKQNGPLRLWVELVNNRLDQTKNYIIGWDISKGQGASNSVGSVYCAETGEKVAEWVSATVPPYDLARIACALALWVGGARKNARPLMIWEAQGPGWDFGRQVVQTYRYPFYYMDRTIGTVVEKRGKKYGWHSTRDKKEQALGMLRRAYAHGGFINHSIEALDEAAEYINYDGGGIGPAALVEESTEAKKCHGDRVIADMLCLWAKSESPKIKVSGPGAPYRSPAWRKKQWDRKRKQRRQAKTFDYRVSEAVA